VQALQHRLNQLTADLTKRQDEYSEMIASLTKSHEEASARQAAHLAAVMEQRIAEANVRDACYWIVSMLGC
jgi:peptidoglycan hydrolase CwlO-like protein